MFHLDQLQVVETGAVAGDDGFTVSAMDSPREFEVWLAAGEVDRHGARMTAGFGQVGFMCTAQGFECDLSGVIVGPDLVWRGNRWEMVRKANRDPSLRNGKTVSDADFDRLVRNVYKVLLTRGMQGVGIYSPDAETLGYLRSIT